MKDLLLIGILIFFIGCRSEHKEVIEKYSNGSVEVEYVYPDKNNKSNYSILEYFEDGSLRFKGVVKDNKFIGNKTSYYLNGQIRQVDSLISSCAIDYCCCDGIVKRFFMNGSPNHSFENMDGLKNGSAILYSQDSSGSLVSQKLYVEGKKQGVSQFFYKSGQLYKKVAYSNDSLIGMAYYFDEKGDTLKIYSTFKGKEDFPTKKWLKNGQIFEAKYIDKDYKKALYIWTDRMGNEIKKELVSPNTGGEWITKSGNWSTSN